MLNLLRASVIVIEVIIVLQPLLILTDKYPNTYKQYKRSNLEHFQMNLFLNFCLSDELHIFIKKLQFLTKLGTELRHLSNFSARSPGTVLKHQLSFLRHWVQQHWDRGGGGIMHCGRLQPYRPKKGTFSALKFTKLQHYKSHFQILFQLILLKIVVMVHQPLFDGNTVLLFSNKTILNLMWITKGICNRLNLQMCVSVNS